MRVSSLSLLFFLSIPVFATPVIEKVELSPSLAKKLGFNVNVELEHDATMVKITGPTEINNGCISSRSGNVVLNSDGNEVALYITELGQPPTAPQTIGYIINSSPNKLGIFIDYFCPGDRGSENRRYSISSIQAWTSY